MWGGEFLNHCKNMSGLRDVHVSCIPDAGDASKGERASYTASARGKRLWGRGAERKEVRLEVEADAAYVCFSKERCLRLPAFSCFGYAVFFSKDWAAHGSARLHAQSCGRQIALVAPPNHLSSVPWLRAALRGNFGQAARGCGAADSLPPVRVLQPRRT